ncbi:endonuclease VII domain-containing protein [Streptomyces sp. CC53]|uniref:endonuclease VII domain-containing protein n=1 Tax=Streptomyces sp. CC53 TaxID=1906740 RepID=UPI001C435496
MTDFSKCCKDCLAEFDAYHAGTRTEAPPRLTRPALNPGPRCATHWREELKRRRLAAHEKHVQGVYGLKEGEYADLYRFQGGLCALCRRATGASRRLSVDHDHATGAVRGLCCRPCNSLLGHARDDPAFFQRCIAYLNDPPYQQLNRQQNKEPDAMPRLRQADETDPDG